MRSSFLFEKGNSLDNPATWSYFSLDLKPWVHETYQASTGMSVKRQKSRLLLWPDLAPNCAVSGWTADPDSWAFTKNFVDQFLVWGIPFLWSPRSPGSHFQTLTMDTSPDQGSAIWSLTRRMTLVTEVAWEWWVRQRFEFKQWVKPNLNLKILVYPNP